MRCGQRVGGLKLPVLQGFARGKMALLPEPAASGWRHIISVNLNEQRRNRALLPGLASPACAFIQETRMLVQRFRDSGHFRVHASAARGKRDARIEQLAVAAIEFGPDARGFAAFVDPQEKICPRAVVCLREQIALAREHILLDRAVERIIAPGINRICVGFARIPDGAVRICQGHLAFAADRS